MKRQRRNASPKRKPKKLLRIEDFRPTSKPAGPIARAHVDRMLEDARLEVARLMPEAIRQKSEGAAVVFLVTDPRFPIATTAPPEALGPVWVEQAARAGDKPLVALLPKATIASMLQPLAHTLEPAAHLLRTLDAPPDGAAVPLIVWRWEVIGLQWVRVAAPTAMSTSIALTDDDVQPREGGHLLTLTGVLKAMLLTDLADLTPEGRPRIQRFQERARAAIATESSRQSPRVLGDVLIATFGGDNLRAAFDERGVEGFVAAIDAALEAGAPS